MLDTSAYSALGRGHFEIRDAIQIAAEIYISPVVLGELRAGFKAGARDEENGRLLRRFLASPRVKLAPVVEDTATCYSQILHYLRGAGTPIPTNDVWIAAGAMERGLTVPDHGRALSRDSTHPIGLPARVPQILNRRTPLRYDCAVRTVHRTRLPHSHII